MAESMEIQFFETKCKTLTEEKEIRFAGIINDKGQLVAGGFKEGLAPFAENESRLHDFMEFASRISLRKEFDKMLGPINYLAARRDKIVLISFPFPVSNFVLLISAEPTVEIENVAKKVVSIFTNVS
ncbi:MAG TPA: DUF6659 family protein [Candidatus Nitrosotenuis sp.]|nr:DUF6659 family protein [Candidatus Nitrosotenuis sp.]